MIEESNEEKFDNTLLEMMKADEIRAAFVPGASKNFYLVEEPWTMLEDPWRCQWYDKRVKSLCEVYPVGTPYSGKVYALFTVYEEIEKRVLNYVFLMENYHFIDSGEEHAPIDD